jgi:hypothetical protein
LGLVAKSYVRMSIPEPASTPLKVALLAVGVPVPPKLVVRTPGCAAMGENVEVKPGVDQVPSRSWKATAPGSSVVVVGATVVEVVELVDVVVDEAPLSPGRRKKVPLFCPDIQDTRLSEPS